MTTYGMNLEIILFYRKFHGACIRFFNLFTLMLDISENIGQNMHWKFIIGRLLYKTIEYAFFVQ